MKIQTSLHLDEKLLEQLTQKAAAEERSLNDYVEDLLRQTMSEVPNHDTQQAIHEAEHNVDLTKIDDLSTYKKSLLSDV